VEPIVRLVADYQRFALFVAALRARGMSAEDASRLVAVAEDAGVPLILLRPNMPAVVQMLLGIKDPAARALAAATAWGRSWQDLAALIRPDLPGALAAVPDGRVLSDSLVDAAVQFAALLDNLSQEFPCPE
jgi:hypothetical protein